MRNYDRINAPVPAGIDAKRAHIIGGGIAGLASAAFLVTDAYMPGVNVTVYESLDVMGGSMDAAGDAEQGFTSRGERELEYRMECLWYLCSKIPSIQTPGLTVLDETHRANVREPIDSKFRLMHKRGQRYDLSGPLMSPHDSKRMFELLMTPEKELENLTARDWFSADFTKSIFWYCWSSMLAFNDFHSVMEVRRYLARFLMYSPGLTRLQGILHTEYNEYDSIIKPLHLWLTSLGVQFRRGTTVEEIEMSTDNNTATGLHLRTAKGPSRIDLTVDDLVFFTNGSLTQNSREGTTDTVPTLEASTTDRGCFSAWEKLAKRHPKFGHPEVFLSNIDKTNWISFFPTIKEPTFFDYMEKKTGNVAGTGGAITIVDSSWKLSCVLYGKYYPTQPKDVSVLWAYGQDSAAVGDFVKKPMKECTGREMFFELLSHCGLDPAQRDRVLDHSNVATSMMPYITSQFMPRKVTDRPKGIPEGCRNLAFIGQFVEVDGDVVFTVETSVRTAMDAVWGLTGLDKPKIPMYEPMYDLRVLGAMIRSQMQTKDFSLATLSSLIQSAPSPGRVVKFLRELPPLP
jgi:oleate hydratase